MINMIFPVFFFRRHGALRTATVHNYFLNCFFFLGNMTDFFVSVLISSRRLFLGEINKKKMQFALLIVYRNRLGRFRQTGESSNASRETMRLNIVLSTYFQ